MVAISIASLIYRSPRFADWVYESVHEFTPHLRRHEAEFFFVANDATPAVRQHLTAKGYPHHVNDNPRRTEAELFALGYGWPEYLHRVYRGWNKAIVAAAGEIVVLVNSDNFFSPDWLTNLLKYATPDTFVCAKLVERRHPRHGVFPGVYQGEFGRHPDSFDRDAFLRFAEARKLTGLERGGAYMPCAFFKRQAIAAGLYPEGNLAGRSFREIAASGDEVFVRRLSRLGVRHVTALDAIVYHCKEGEMDEPTTATPLGVPAGTSMPSPAAPATPSPRRPFLPVRVAMYGERQYLALGHAPLIRAIELAQRVRQQCVRYPSAVKGLAKRYVPSPVYRFLRLLRRRVRGRGTERTPVS